MDMSTAIVVGLHVLLQLVARSASDGQVEQILAVTAADGLPRPWISELFHQALANFTVRHVGSSTCRLQSDMYDRHLRNHTSWAVRSEYLHIYYNHSHYPNRLY